ncbi:transposase-like protein [Beauveria brongniartii RCEF 3172]|uniref:Transposase-like protein n=1 Tax=Beauveria brongniartii RCEF 3172 TaxID=1081107 RepID=A0A166VXM7_9HYPO|nr:transposase-like protein [Beauveria brongniartii RCEF 3172]
MSQQSSRMSCGYTSHVGSPSSTIETFPSVPLNPSDSSVRKTRKRQATANTWAHAREPQDAEPARCPRKDEKIYYCMHCRDPTYSTTVLTTFRRHLLKAHGIELSAPDHPIKRQRDNLIQDAFAKAGEVNASKQSARQEAALRAAVNRKAALEALIQLVTVRNLSCNCSSWPELHALICAVNYTAQDLISLSHGSIQKLVSNSYCVTRRETRDKHDSDWVIENDRGRVRAKGGDTAARRANHKRVVGWYGKGFLYPEEVAFE